LGDKCVTLEPEKRYDQDNLERGCGAMDCAEWRITIRGNWSDSIERFWRQLTQVKRDYGS